MSRHSEHLIVIMLQPPPEPEFEIWPPHITVVPWFPVDDSAKLDELLSDLARRHEPIQARAGALKQWGDREKFDVQLIIDPANKLHSLHWDVVQTLEKNHYPIHQKELLGRSYRPHITLRNSLSKAIALPTGQEILIERFSLIAQKRLKGSGRMIKSEERSYELGG